MDIGTFGILSGDSKCLYGDIPARHGSSLQLCGQCAGNTPAARTNIEDVDS